MSKLILCSLMLALSGCASMEQRTAKAQTCLENSMFAVLTVEFKGLDVFNNLCEKHDN
jgi:hypothetical protein